MAAIRDDGPAVVGALANEVDLIPTPRTVFSRPELPVCVEARTLRVSMPVGSNLGADTVLANEWVIRRHGAIAIDADDGSCVIVTVLRG